MLIDDEGVVRQERASAIGELVRVVILQKVDKLNDFKHLYKKFGGDHLHELSRDEIESECPNWFSRWIVAQTFTAMSLEAFYYDYIQNKASKNQAEKRRTPSERFSFICHDLLKASPVKVVDLVNKVSLLDKTRTHWAHNKSSDFINYRRVKDFFSPDECVEILIEVFGLVFEYDRSYIFAREIHSILNQVQVNAVNEIDALSP
ncbi:hypothetical protein AAG587_06715 [Vreelandella neptunia]|uniref:hypothetical protein n=1 Tax=Vreelandella neptunia TaxID=115551 RepID=UPI00315A6108